MGNFKIQTWHIIVFAIAAMFFLGIIEVDYGGEVPGLPGQPGTPPATGMEIVTKPIKFVVKHKYGGAAATGTGGYLYEEDGVTLAEGGSSKFSSGVWTTSIGYASDRKMVLKYVYDTTNDDILWYPFTVPRMTSADAESLTSNSLTVEIFGLPTLTDTAKTSASATAIGDAGNWNKTTGDNPGQDIATCTYSWFVAADNTGFISSHDPEYDIDLEAVIWVKVFGTNYENVILTGFDGGYEKGAAMYYYHVIDDTEICKYKVGSNYIYNGAGDFTWTVDVSGYTGDAADMQIYLEVYSSPLYHQTYGSYGPGAVELAEQTINLVD